MKKTVVEYITDTLEDIPKQSLQTNKRRLHAFFSEQETIEKRGTHFVFRYAFYSVEKLRRPTKQSLFKEYNMLCSDLKSTPSGEISDMEYKDVVLYGNTSSPVVQERLTEYLERNNSLKIQLSFCDEETSECKTGENIAYAELQKALFYCKRKKYLLLFISVRDLIQDIRFHDCRHIFASTAAMLNVPEKYAMEMGGWSTPDVYKNVYQETFDSERNKADSVIDGYFNEIIQNH